MRISDDFVMTNYREEVERIESRIGSWPLREKQIDELNRYYRNQPRRVKEIPDINWEDEGEHRWVLNGMVCDREPWVPIERIAIGLQELEKNRYKFLDELKKRRITDAAKGSIEEMLYNLMATPEVSFREMEQNKPQAYIEILRVIDLYLGRYSKVPCLYIANKLRDRADGLPRRYSALREIVLQVANAVEAVRGKKSKT